MTSVPNRGDIHVRLISIEGLDQEFVGRWTRLAEDALEPNPFFEAPMVLAAAQHLAGEVAPMLLIAEHSGELTFVLPVRRSRHYRRIPIRTLVSWCHNYCYLGTPLVSSAFPEATWAAVLMFLHRERPASWFCLDLVNSGGAVADAFSRACAAIGGVTTTLSTSDRAILDRTMTPTYVSERFSGSGLKALRRKQRRLGEALGGAITVDDIARGDPLELRSAVEHFLALEAAGWKGEDGGAMNSAGHGEFFIDLCMEFAARGQLELLRIGSSGQTVAYACNIRSGSREFGFKVSYDPEFARYSPGMLLELEKLKELSAASGRSAMTHARAPTTRCATSFLPIASISPPLRSRLPRGHVVSP